MSDPISTGRGPARRSTRRRSAALLVFLATVALSTGVIASAASLGGLHTQDLGAGTWGTNELSGVSIDYTPEWQDETWVLAQVSMNAHRDRGLRTGDEVKVTLQMPGETREVVTTINEPAMTLAWSGSQFVAAGTPATGSGPVLTDVHRIAVSVTGADGETRRSSVGDLGGSLAGYSGAAVHGTRDVQAETETIIVGDQEQIETIHLTVPQAQVSDLIGAMVAVVLPGTGRSSSGVITGASPAPITVRPAPDDGARITLDLAEPWPLAGNAELHAALATTQHLTGAGGAGAVSTVSWTEEATSSPPNRVGSALEAVQLSPGIAYDYTWGGEHNYGLGYQHTFTVTNTSSDTVTDWTIQFDTTLPPLWGADPTAGDAVELVWPLETREYDRDSGLWTIGSHAASHRTLDPGQSRSFMYHAYQVPVPEVDPELFDAAITVSGQDNHVTFDLEVTTTSPFYVPWSMEVDLADYVCSDRLDGASVIFSQVVATPVPGSSTRYLIEGMPGDTQLVRASQPRQFTFADFSPGPGWELSCPETS